MDLPANDKEAQWIDDVTDAIYDNEICAPRRLRSRSEPAEPTFPGNSYADSSLGINRVRSARPARTPKTRGNRPPPKDSGPERNPVETSPLGSGPKCPSIRSNERLHEVSNDKPKGKKRGGPPPTGLEARKNSGKLCTATRRNGTPCGNFAILGAPVCRVHGGNLPAVRKAAQVRLLRSADLLMAELLKIAMNPKIPVQHRLVAIRDGL